MPYTNTSSISEMLKQVNEPFYAIKKNGLISFSPCPVNSDEKELLAFVPAIPLKNLGDQIFKKRHGIIYPYIAGAMANGITSASMVKAMANNGMLSFFGAGGLCLEEIENNIIQLKTELKNRPFGFNLIHSINDPDLEMKTVKLYLKQGIRLISAAAFMRMTPALVYFRVKGVHKNQTGTIITPNKIIAKVSRIGIAKQFFSPPPAKLLSLLLAQHLITREEAQLARFIPMAQDLTAEADSGGHTDNRPALALLPAMLSLKNEFMEKYHYPDPLCVGLAGGISTPESAAAAFGMGAAYILTGSVNQSCVEAGICDDVKKMLCLAEQADVAMAPAADMFEIGAKVQVLKRGTLFPVRAKKLYRLFQSHDCFEDIDDRLKSEIQTKFLQNGFEDAWNAVKSFFKKTGNFEEIEKGEQNPKHKMALVFRSYLGQSSKWAIQGTAHRKMDYQIWCGPAIGAFNQWVKGSFLDTFENRKTDEIALNILWGASVCLRASMLGYQNRGIDVGRLSVKPLRKARLQHYI